jgi:hypothetical protein
MHVKAESILVPPLRRVLAVLALAVALGAMAGGLAGAISTW